MVITFIIVAGVNLMVLTIARHMRDCDKDYNRRLEDERIREDRLLGDGS